MFLCLFLTRDDSKGLVILVFTVQGKLKIVNLDGIIRFKLAFNFIISIYTYNLL